MTKKIDAPQELSDEDLDDAKGGAVFLTHAVQKVDPSTSDGDKLTSDNGQTEYRPKPVIVTSYSTGGDAD